MKNFFILEDHREQAEALAVMIRQYSPDALVSIATSIEEAALVLKRETYDLFFLDILLSEDDTSNSDGISFGKLLRSTKPYQQTPIIYITSYASYMSEAINKIHCYGFLQKPYTQYKVFALLDYLINSPSNIALQIKTESCVYRDLLFTDMIHIHSRGHNLNYTTIKGNFLSRQFTMSDLTTLLPDYFLRCHKSYWVNRHYISSIDTTSRYIHLRNCTDTNLWLH